MTPSERVTLSRLLSDEAIWPEDPWIVISKHLAEPLIARGWATRHPRRPFGVGVGEKEEVLYLTDAGRAAAALLGIEP